MDREAAGKVNQAGDRKDSGAPARPPAHSTLSHPIVDLKSGLGNRAIGRIIQAKLRVSEPADVYEQEADRVAEDVMRSAAVSPARSSGEEPPEIQQKCAPCDATKGPCPKCDEEEEKPVQRQAASAAELVEQPPGALPDLSGGRPLPEPVRQFFEPRFGADFSRVRIHTDARAAESAQALNALAYTAGSNVVFAAGQFTPETESGRRLLAHELTHVIQQNRAAEAVIRRKPGPPIKYREGFSSTLDPAERRQIFYFEDTPWVTITWPRGARVESSLDFAPRQGFDAVILKVKSESALTIEVDRETQNDVMASRLGTNAGVGYEFTCPGTLTGLVQTEEQPDLRIKLPVRYLLVEKRPGAIVIPREGELPSDVLATERTEIWENFEMPDSYRSFDSLKKLRQYLNANPKLSAIVLRMPDGRYVVRPVSEAELRRLAEAARRSRYHPEKLEGVMRYRGKYARGSLETMMIEGVEYSNLDALADSYYDDPVLAGEGQQGDPSECEVFRVGRFFYGRKALTHAQAVARWQQLDRLKRSEVDELETEPGHKFAELRVKGVSRLHDLGIDYFYGRDLYRDLLDKFDRAAGSEAKEKLLDSVSRALVEFLYTEADRETDNPSLIAGLKARESVADRYALWWHSHIEYSAQMLAIDLLSSAVEQIRAIADSEEKMRRFVIGFPGLEAKQQRDTLQLLGVPGDKVGLFQALLADKKTAYSVALGNDESGVSIGILRGFADKNLKDIEDGIAGLRKQDVLALRLKGDFGKHLRTLTYRKFGFSTLDPDDYPHRGRTPDFLPSALGGKRGEFASLGEELFAARAKYIDSVDTIEKIFIGIGIAIVTVVLVLLFNVAGAFIAEAVFGLAAGTTAHFLVAGAIAGFLTAGTGLLTKKYVFGQDVTLGEAALELAIGTFTGAAFGALGRLLKGAGTALRLGIEATAFLAISIGEFYRTNKRLPAGNEWYWLIYENALNFALLQAGSVLARPLVGQAGFWSRAIRLGGNETRINDFTFEVGRLNKDVAAFAVDPKRTPFEAARLKAKQIELLKTQRDLVNDLQKSYRTRPEAKQIEAEARPELEQINDALKGLEVTDLLAGLRIQSLGESQTVFEYQAGPGAAEKFKTLFPNAKINAKEDGQVEILMPGEKEPYLFVPRGAAVPAAVPVPGTPAKPPPVNINIATAEELARLPDIGKKRAEAIVRDREANGEFKTVDDITRVEGIGDGLRRKLLDFITTEAVPAKGFFEVRDPLVKRQEALLERADRLGFTDPTIDAIRKNKLMVYSRTTGKGLAEAERLIDRAEKIAGPKINKLAERALKNVSRRLAEGGMTALRDGSLASMTDADVGAALLQVKGLKNLDVPQLRGVLHAWRAKVDLTNFLDIARGMTVADRNFALESYGRMKDLGITGCDRVITDMGRSRRGWDGGMFSLESARYEYGLENIKEFEAKVTGQGERRDYDIVLKSEKKIELKNWAEWDADVAAKLADQHTRDVKISGNDPGVFKKLGYVFRFPAPRSPESIRSFLRENLRAYLDREVAAKSIDAERAKSILDAFDAQADLVSVSTARRAGSVPSPVQPTPVAPVQPPHQKEKEEPADVPEAKEQDEEELVPALP